MILSPGNIQANSLPSEIFRAAIGTRNVNMYDRMRTNNQGQARNQRFEGFGRIVGGNLLDWVIKNIGNYILQSALTLYTMDWNKTDAEIEAQIKANETVVATQLGQLSANTLVYSLGIGFSTTAAMRYPVVAGRTALTVAEEGGEEVRASLRSFFTATRNATASSAMLSTYLSGRKLMFGAQKDKREPWIASDQLDKLIATNKDPNVRAYWNGFKDQFEDAILDLGMIVNMGILESYEVNKANKAAILGKNRIVEITPDVTKPTETVWMYGNQSQLIPQISNVIAQSRMLDGKDVGEIIGAPYGEANHAEDTKRILKFFFSESVDGRSKIFKDGDIKRPTIAELKLSDVKPGITWNDLKTAATEYTRGNIIVTAFLSNKRQIQLYCANKSSGENMIRRMVALTTATILKFAYSEQDPENPVLRKEILQMHPVKALLEVKKETSVLSDIRFRNQKGEGFKMLRAKGKLWGTEEQSGWTVIP